MSEMYDKPTRHVMLTVETALIDADESVDGMDQPGKYYSYMQLLQPQLGPRRNTAVLARTDSRGPLEVRERAVATELFDGQTIVAVRAIQIVGGLRVAMHRIVRFDETKPIYQASVIDLANPQDPHSIGVITYIPSRGEDQPPANAEALCGYVPGICIDDSPAQMVRTMAELIVDDRLLRG